jgi:hypothetical protein
MQFANAFLICACALCLTRRVHRKRCDAEVVWTLEGVFIDSTSTPLAIMQPTCSGCAPSWPVPKLFLKQSKGYGFVMSNTRGIHKKPMSDHALAFIFSWLRNFPQVMKNQTDAVETASRHDTAGKRRQTVGIIGLGSIGTEIARKMQGAGFSRGRLQTHPCRVRLGGYAVSGRPDGFAVGRIGFCHLGRTSDAPNHRDAGKAQFEKMRTPLF